MIKNQHITNIDASSMLILIKEIMTECSSMNNFNRRSNIVYVLKYLYIIKF